MKAVSICQTDAFNFVLSIGAAEPSRDDIRANTTFLPADIVEAIKYVLQNHMPAQWRGGAKRSVQGGRRGCSYENNGHSHHKYYIVESSDQQLLKKAQFGSSISSAWLKWTTHSIELGPYGEWHEMIPVPRTVHNHSLK